MPKVMRSSSHESALGEQTADAAINVSHASGSTFLVRLPSGQTLTVSAGSAGPVFLGNSAAADLRVEDAEVSRRHLALEVTPRGLRVTDQDSRNGTWCNGMRITSVYLQGGERLRIGKTDVAIELAQKDARTRLWPTDTFGPLFGASQSMRRIFPVLQRFAESNIPLIIEGETGTGKGLAAQAIHDASERKDGPWVLFDCTDGDAKRAERTLFGEEGDPEALGQVFEAEGGTLVLDEITSLHPSLQSKLMRLVERSEACRVHGSHWKRVDVRIMATTTRDPEQEVEAGRLREELFYRLNVVGLRLPPLREREGDVPLLAARFWAELAGGLPYPIDMLAGYERNDWPGNVRELRNLVSRRLALGEEHVSQATKSAREHDLERALTQAIDLGLSFSQARERFIGVFERCYLNRALEAHRGNVSRAAAASGLARRYFHVLKRRHKRAEGDS